VLEDGLIGGVIVAVTIQTPTLCSVADGYERLASPCARLPSATLVQAFSSNLAANSLRLASLVAHHLLRINSRRKAKLLLVTKHSRRLASFVGYVVAVTMQLFCQHLTHVEHRQRR
tara:strand:- start:1325 stop:1672 length:348 start_codon:yes stop_codon:yes gene_type:complete